MTSEFPTDLLREMEAYRVPHERQRKESALTRRIDRADSVPTHVFLMDEFGISVPSEVDKSWKMFCPFQQEHLKGLADKDTRVYADGTVYCFSSLDHGRMGPVSMLRKSRGWGLYKALEYLEDKYSLERREHYQDKMARLITERSAAQHKAVGDPTDAVAALQAAARTIPGYVETQWDDEVLAAFQREVVALADAISAPEGAVLAWLAQATKNIQVAVDTCQRHA